MLKWVNYVQFLMDFLVEYQLDILVYFFCLVWFEVQVVVFCLGFDGMVIYVVKVNL